MNLLSLLHLILRVLKLSGGNFGQKIAKFGAKFGFLMQRCGCIVKSEQDRSHSMICPETTQDAVAAQATVAAIALGRVDMPSTKPFP